MDKITTLNTLKNVFSALGAKTSDSNYAVGLFDKTNGEPKGLMEMSYLASVLGVKQYVMDIPKGEYTSLGDLPDGIFWVTTDAVVQQACQDWPDGISKSGEMITFSIKRGTYGLQFMIQSYGWLCIRNLSTTWQAWKKIQLT